MQKCERGMFSRSLHIMHSFYYFFQQQEECAISANLVGKADEVALFQDLPEIIEKLNKLNEVR